MKVGSNRQTRVYLNGEVMHEYSGYRENWVEDTVAEIDLKAGVNVLVFKAVNWRNPGLGSIWFTDHAGSPIEGLSVTLDPNDLEEN